MNRDNQLQRFIGRIGIIVRPILLFGLMPPGCQSPARLDHPKPAAAQFSLADVQKTLSEAEFSLASHHYEAAVVKAEKLWKLIPNPDRYEGSVKEYKLLVDAAARSGEIPIIAWRRHGDFINERQAIEACGKRYPIAEAYASKILQQVESIIRDSKMKKELMAYRSEQQILHRRWLDKLILAAAVAEVLSRSGHNRTAVGVLRQFQSKAEADIPDELLRTEVLEQWKSYWQQLGFESMLAHAIDLSADRVQSEEENDGPRQN
ncbi:MAG: hypothetical protein ACE5EQ_00030 [Phycisphaerae bacterium]